MSAVSTKPLRDLCTFRHGGTPSKSNASFWKGDIPWVSPKDMKQAVIDNTTDFISAEAVANSATSVVPPDSILLVVRSGILAHSFPVAKVAKPVAFNQDIKAVTPISADVVPDYLYWFLRSQSMNVVTRGVKKGATVHSVQSGFIESLMVPMHPREEQHRIVDLLSRAEGIVRLRREAQQKAAELIPAIFIDMFGNPATNSKGWPVSTLGEVLVAADYGSSTKASQTDSGLPIIRMGNVTTAGDLDLDDLKYVELSSADGDRFRLRKGDLLFNRTNSKDLVGKTGLWDGRLDAVLASYFIRLRARSESAHPTYLWAWMNSRHMKRVLFDTARGAIGQANINSKELKAFPVAIPPLKLQHEFDARVQEIASIQSQQRAAVGKAVSAFEALLAHTISNLQQ